MNKRLAISKLESILNYADNTIDWGKISIEDMMSILEMSISCIEKGIPIEPYSGDGGEFICPICCGVVEGDFCSNCGQRVDWVYRKRDILFRGKRLDNGEWLYGNLVQGGGLAFIGVVKVSDTGEIGTDMEEVSINTVGQYIGIKDTNGVEIFEGDVVMLSYTDFPIVLLANWDLRLENSYDVDLIGNIHDNPELLRSVWGE